MKRHLVAAIAAVAIACAPAVALADAGGHPASAAPSAIAAKSCGAGYTRAIIGGQVKCLRRGEYCAIAYKSQYKRYGFTCSGNPPRLH